MDKNFSKLIYLVRMGLVYLGGDTEILKASCVCVGPDNTTGTTLYHCCEGDKISYDSSQSEWLCHVPPSSLSICNNGAVPLRSRRRSLYSDAIGVKKDHNDKETLSH